MSLNKKSKLKLDLELSIVILLIIFPATISMKKIKWFAYCYFDNDANRVVDSLSCGKCIEDLSSPHENEPDSPFNHRKGIRFRRDLNDTIGTNSTKIETIEIENNSTIDEKNQTARLGKKSQSHESNSYCSYFKANFDSSLHQHESIRLSNEREINVIPLLPDLTHDWYNFDLLYLIEKNDVSTNLDNLTYFSRIPQTLKKIELIDFGIESIKYNAFKNFPKLQVIRLRNNNLNTVELSSFVTPSEDQSNQTDDEDDEIEESTKMSGEKSSAESSERNKRQSFRNKESDGKLIELDLSSNKLYNIKLENFVYLKSLRVLNLSNNYLRHFDLQFLSIVTPHLQVLDLSGNQIKRLRVIDNRVYFSSPSSISSLINDNSYISLVTNLILNELVFLNLENNALDHLDQLYSISFALVDDQRFCNLSNSISSMSTTANQRPILSINIRNNRWKCDCRTFELIDSLRQILTSNTTENANNSCYLNYLFRVNSFIFANLINFTQNNVTCFSKKLPHSWPVWYQDKCSNQTVNTSDSSTIFSKVISKSSSSNSSTRSNTPSSISFKSNSFYSFGERNRNSMSTPRVSLLKYDITNLFYWISSICLSVVTISCLLLAWYYCWKRYQSQSAAAATMAAQSTLSNHQQQAYRREMSGALNQFMTGRRSDMYLLNSRLSRANGGGGASPSSATAPYLYQISLNRNARDEIVRGERIRNGTTNNPNLYYISLNPNSSFRGVGGNGGVNNNSSAYVNVGYQSSRAANGVSDIDEPPNYYEAILVGGTMAVNNATNNNNTNTTNSLTLNTRTLITNSLNKNQQQQQRNGELLNSSDRSDSPSQTTTRSSSRPDEEIDEAADRIVIVADQDEITTTTTTTRLREEPTINGGGDAANDLEDNTSANDDPNSAVDFLDVSSMIDDSANNTTSATFFIDSNLVQSRRGRSTDV